MERFDLRDWPEYLAAGGATETTPYTTQVVVDSRCVTQQDALFVALPGRFANGHQFVRDAAQRGARYALVQRDWQPPEDLPATIRLLRVHNPLSALQDIARAYRTQKSSIVIGVTGSQGKTMLKDMLHNYLSGTFATVVSPESFNSQIGAALSLFSIHSTHQVAIIEAGISQVGEMQSLSQLILPDHAIITQIGDQHLATLHSREGIAAEKAQLANAVPPGRWVILPDDPAIIPCVDSQRHPLIFWNREDPRLPYVKRLPSTRAGVLPFAVQFPDGAMTQGELSFGFTYLLDLMTIATKAAWLLGVASKTLAERIAHYRPESTHTEIWRAPNGIMLINRAYCADPQSLAVNLEKLNETPAHGQKHLLFGGMRTPSPSCASMEQLGMLLRAQCLHGLYLYGDDDFTPLMNVLKTTMTQVKRFPTYQEALQDLRNLTRPGDTILIQGPHKCPVDQVIAAFDDSVSHNICLIHLPAIKHNLNTLRQHIRSTTRLMVIVKALAYGTEDIRMARYLASCGVDILGVSYVDEGVALKRSGVSQAIFAFNLAPYEVAKAVKWNIEVGVQDKLLIEALAKEAAAQGKTLPVHLHVDTGMGRLGCRLEDSLALAQRICSLPSLRFEGLMTHFSCADDPLQDSFTQSQIDAFTAVRQQLRDHHLSPRYAHAANSAATLRFPEAEYDMVRVGLAVYGLHASLATKQQAELKSALSLTSRVVGINAMRAGDSVGYNRRYQVQRPVERIAILPLGYYDGIHRHFSEKGAVMIRGQSAPIVGNICMDYLMVDVTSIPDVQVGDPVLVFGQDDYGQTLAPEAFAKTGNSIVHELIACLGPRIQRIFVDE